MNYVLFDDASRNNLLPLTFTRPVADIRIGILTIRQKWERLLGKTTSTLTENYLSEKYPLIQKKNTILINGSVVPTPELVEKIIHLKPNELLMTDECIIAQCIDMEDLDSSLDQENENITHIKVTDCFIKISYPWDIFSKNGQAIALDFEMITHGRKSQPLSKSNTLLGNSQMLFIEEGAKIEGAILNTETGPIYIGKDAEIMEGSVIRGPFALCEHATVKMSAKIYGPTTIGPFSKVGGELNNVVILACSNKAHDGFLGNSVIGEWCNLGADTNTSNLKNTYNEVKVWNYPSGTFIHTGLQFCGLIMGDHSKCAINTMFNTGTVVGVSANVFGSGLQRNFIASFSWGGTAGFTHYDIDKALDVARLVYKRRNLEFSELDEEILRQVAKLTRDNVRR